YRPLSGESQNPSRRLPTTAKTSAATVSSERYEPKGKLRNERRYSPDSKLARAHRKTMVPLEPFIAREQAIAATAKRNKNTDNNTVEGISSRFSVPLSDSSGCGFSKALSGAPDSGGHGCVCF